jgi:hypothetical protein
MLRAQEMIDPVNKIQFYYDRDGLPGGEMENDLLQDLVRVIKDTDMPHLTVHVRAFIKVVVEPLSEPNCLLAELSLIGNETIGDIKKMSFEHFRTQAVLLESVELEHIQLYVNGDVLVDDSVCSCTDSERRFQSNINGDILCAYNR